MEKIIVIGSPGTGKSTFATKLHKCINIPLFHLDLIWHKKDKTNITRDEFDELLETILKKDKWIIDGNYDRTLEMRLKVCDTVFLLDYPVNICLEGAKSRINKERDDFPWIEETIDKEFEQDIINFPKNNLPKIYNLLEKYQQDKNIIIFKSRIEAANYLNKLTHN